MLKQTILQADPRLFQGRRVLVRVDFNVPLAKDQGILDDSRIRAALPTLEFLQRLGAKIILVSHLGRPKGPSKELSLRPIAQRLSELIKQDVVFVPDCIGLIASSVVGNMQNGQISLLENVRFYREEEKNDSKFAAQLAALADIYVNDAFGAAHRAHASTQGVSAYLHPALAGLLMDKELKALYGLLDNPAKPFALVVGGAKVSSKIGVLDNLLSRLDLLIIGGAMAFSFLKAQGYEIGNSLVENDRLDYCKELLDKAQQKKVKILLPQDIVCAYVMKAGETAEVVPLGAIRPEQMGLDLGPVTLELIKKALKDCKTILWNGPLGAFEIKGFEKATCALVDALVKLTASGAKTVVGGGDSLAAIESCGASHSSFTHVSTGGGACLEFLEGLPLPGISCLDPAAGATATF